MRSTLARLPLIAALTLVAQLGAGSVARADTDARTPALWAPYVVVGETTIEITNTGDGPTWPRIELKLAMTDPDQRYCYGVCTYEIQAPRIEPGGSWTFDLADRACGSGPPTSICLPDGAAGGATLQAAIQTGTGANAGATSADPDGSIAAVVTTASGTYDAVVPAPEFTLADVGRRISTTDGLSTAIRLIGDGDVTVDWYAGDVLIVEQHAALGVYCCGETGYNRTRASSIDPRDGDGLDDDTAYTVVITDARGGVFAAVTTDAVEER